MSTIVVLPTRVLADDARLRRHVVDLAAQSGCEHRIEYAEDQRAYITPDGVWHDTRLWHGMAQGVVRGRVVLIDWKREVVVVDVDGREVVVGLGVFLPSEDMLCVGDEVELLWTVQEEVSGRVLK
jgi:hypothetical protein